jgi:hypothetical protein
MTLQTHQSIFTDAASVDRRVSAGNRGPLWSGLESFAREKGLMILSDSAPESSSLGCE